MSELHPETGLPVHLGMPVNRDGQGPLDKGDPAFVGWQCWCGDPWCEAFQISGAGVQALDVKDRLIIFRYAYHLDSEVVRNMVEKLESTATNMKEAGAIAVLFISDDITLESLNEQHLTDLGLRKVDEE